MQTRLFGIFKPAVTVGHKDDPYLLRWRILPRNKWFNMYIHKFLRSDDDRALHDHEYDNISIILKGEYIEKFRYNNMRYRPTGCVSFRKAETPHRILLCTDEYGIEIPCWSLFITGPRYREWGFHCPNGWRHWKDFLTGDYTKGEESYRGKGCE